MADFNLGNVYSQAEDIIGARLRNQTAANALDQQQKTQDATAAAASGIPGDPTIRALAAVNPGGAAQMNTLVQGMTDQQKTLAKQNADEIGKAAQFVLGNPADPTTQTPELLEQRYQQVKGMLPQEIQAKMPLQYDPNFVHLAISNAAAADAALNSSPVTGAVSDLGKLGQDKANGLLPPDIYHAAVTKATTISPDLTTGAPAHWEWADPTNQKLGVVPIKGDPVSDPAIAKPGVTAEQSNSIRTTVVGQFGGTYDPQTGAFAFADPTQAPRALSAMANAEALVGHGTPVLQAVAKAMAQQPPAAAPPASLGANPGIPAGATGGPVDYSTYFQPPAGQ